MLQAEQAASKIAEESTHPLFNERTASIADAIRKDYERTLAEHDSSIEEGFVDLKKYLEHEVAAIVVQAFHRI